MYVIGDITGALILNHVDRASIGKWNEAKIELDIDKGALSVPGLCIATFTDLAASTGTDIGSFTTGQTAQLNAALLYYIAGEYKDLDIKSMPGDACNPDEYLLRANYYELSCKFLTMVSPTMAAQAAFCSYTGDSLEDVFGSTGYFRDMENVLEL